MLLLKLASAACHVSLLPSGELKHSIDEALADGNANGSPDTVQQQIHKLLKDNPVMLFMKGQPCACFHPSLTESILHHDVRSRCLVQLDAYLY